MKRGFSSIFLLIISLILVTAFLFNISNKKEIPSKASSVLNPQEESLALLNKTIDQLNTEDVNIEKSDNKKLLGVKTGTNYTALVYDLASSTVVTDTGVDSDCGNECTVKPLSQYVKEQGGRGGMNGTYFCPPDYGWCAGKKNSFDFPVWNNRLKKWIQADKLFWNDRGMMVFRSGSAQFFPNSAAVGAPNDITGGIVNYPSLLSGGSILVNNDNLAANFKTKATRSGIGYGGGKLYLVVARSSSLIDLTGIFISLGAKDALNLDGGGSAALYEGRYRAGPGRNLPSAIIVK